MDPEAVEIQEEQLPHQETAGDEEVCVNSRNPQSVHTTRALFPVCCLPCAIPLLLCTNMLTDLVFLSII